MKANDARLRTELEERLRFETLIADLSSKFVNLPAGEVDREIMDALRRICETLGLDLTAVWQWSYDGPGRFVATHYYNALQGPQSPGDLRQEDYPWLGQQLLAGRINVFPSLDDFPPDAALDRENCWRLGIKSHLSFPLAVGREATFGILGLNTARKERDWPDALVKRLQVVAQIFGNALARKRADLALRESEERMTLAVEAAQFGIWGWNIARNEVWGSERWRHLFGFVSGEDVSLERVMQRIHQDDRETVDREVRRAIADRNDYAGEFRVVLPDGTQRWIASRGRGHRGANETPARMLGAAIDITERKRTEEALRASEARLAAGTELAGLGYYEVDYGERTCFIDERFRDICGVPPSLQQGLQPVEFWMEHVHPDDRQSLFDERQKLHDGRVDRISAEYRYLHPTHGQKWVHHSARSAGRSAAGDGIRTFGVIRDITATKRAELETHELRNNLAHLARVTTLGALSGSLAHELNQPLGIMLSNAQAAQELLAQEPPDVAEVQAILSDIVAADRRAGEVIERLRALLKHGQASLLPLPLNQLVDEVLHLARADLIGRGVTVARELAPDLPPIAGDRVQLQQIVLNLILNAAEAMATNPPGARRLHLQTMLYQGRVRVSVRDEGSGLPADVERLFQPFYTTKPHGLGMGLAICRSLVAAHHGRLWAEPHPERGAVFHFELPVAETRDEGRGAREGAIG
jgi:two-component system, LuxR family, sensor kinase FixL